MVIDFFDAICYNWNDYHSRTEVRINDILFNYPDASCDLLQLDIELGDMNGMEPAHGKP